MLRVLLFTNTIAPYRWPVFEHLAQSVDLTVLAVDSHPTAHPNTLRLGSSSFRHHLLPSFLLRWRGAALRLTPSAWRYGWAHPFDVLVLGDNRRTALDGWVLRQVARLRRRPLVVWTGYTPRENRVAHSPRWWQHGFAYLRRQGFRQAAALLAYGTATRRTLEATGIARDLIFAGTQAVPPLPTPPPAPPSDDPGLTVLSVAAFTPRKGLDVLLAAFRLVAQPKDRLVLVGDGPEAEGLKRAAAADGRILFPGYLTGSEKAHWYARADIFVLPTRHDPWGLVVNEAMAFGLPIITTSAAGCVLDLVQDNGFVVPPNDMPALADALKQLLGDAALRQRMGQHSHSLIEPYTVEHAADTFRQALHHAAAIHPTVP